MYLKIKKWAFSMDKSITNAKVGCIGLSISNVQFSIILKQIGVYHLTSHNERLIQNHHNNQKCLIVTLSRKKPKYLR